MLLLYGAAILFSAALLFLVEPMSGKMLLPLLGGVPAVWNTCMVFFQVGLLLGYAYAHVLTRQLGRTAQAVTHGAVLALALLVLPIGVRAGAAPPAEGSPVLWTLGALGAAIGVPFFILSTTGPLLQRWFAMTRHREAGDPYFLYAASNVGSLGGLLAYPLLVEPLLPLGAAGGGRWGWTQTGLWSLGYILFAILTALCAVAMLRARRPEEERRRDAGPPQTIEPGKAWRERARWVAYAFVPSSVMLGATQYMTTDLASVPLLWVAPLAAYLVTFILAFSRRQWIPSWGTRIGFSVLAVTAAASFWVFFRPYWWLMLPLHPLVVLATGLVCHGRLAAERPPTARLTEYYLTIALGGALGGAFNALLAPALFEKVGVIEYPLILLLAAFLVAMWAMRGGWTWRSRAVDVVLPAGLVVLVYAMDIVVEAHPTAQSGLMVAALEAGVPSLACLFLILRPLAFALGLGVLLTAGWIPKLTTQEILYQERTFYGLHRVIRSESGPFEQTTPDGGRRVFMVPYNLLYHGSTRHGLQALDPKLGAIPTSYFHPSSPIGEVFRAFGSTPRLDRVAIVGLGAGTLAAYGRQGQTITFYELDPEVVRIARDSGFFTYLRDSKAEIEYLVGDGRVSLSRAPDGHYGLIVLDAFSSDAIPMHLLTREAIQLYLTKLRPDGLLAVQITNQYVGLEPVLDALAADLGLAGLGKSVEVATREEAFEAKDRSTWAILARDRASLWPLNQGSTWIVLPLSQVGAKRESYLWTDDYSNIFRVLRD